MDENITCQPPFNCPRIARIRTKLAIVSSVVCHGLDDFGRVKKSKRININNSAREVKQIRRGRLGHVPTSAGIDFNKLN